MVVHEIWKCNKCQASALESILLGRAKRSLDAHLLQTRTYNEAVRRDMGLETLMPLMPICKEVRMIEDVEKFAMRVITKRWDMGYDVGELFEGLGLDQGEL